MSAGELLFALAVVALVLGGLWAHQWLCAVDDARRHRRWVRERERVLAELEGDEAPQDDA